MDQLGRIDGPNWSNRWTRILAADAGRPAALGVHQQPWLLARLVTREKVTRERALTVGERDLGLGPCRGARGFLY